MKAALVVLLALASAPALAAPADRGFDTPPSWRKKPTSEELLAVWPTKALSQGVDGDATIRCQVSLEGALFDCVVISEKPEAMGFGLAAVALTPQLLMNPALKNGRPVVAPVNIPIAFKGLRGRPANFGARTMLSTVAWTAAPSYSQVAAAFPAKARNTSTPGHVALRCTVRDEGALGLCSVVSEEPRGLGFGKAAQNLTQFFRAPLVTADGKPTRGADVHLAVTFAVEMLGANPRIGRPLWVGFPSGEDLVAGLPRESRTGEPGAAVLDCEVVTGGHVADCKIAEETPQGRGYGPAALAASGKIVLSLWTDEGLPTLGGRVRVPIRYRFD